jgi:hypothetical protein
MWPENSEWILFPGSAGPSDADADAEDGATFVPCATHIWERLTRCLCGNAWAMA